jgi:ankyrin repeat protein
VSVLLKDARVDPAAQKQAALIAACRNGHPEVVRHLLNARDSTGRRVVDPTVKDNFCLLNSALNGSADVVRLLIEEGGVDPSVNGNKAMKAAVEHKHTELIALLASDPRVSFKYEFKDTTSAGVMYNALREQQRVDAEVAKVESERSEQISQLNQRIASLKGEIADLKGVYAARTEENDSCKEAIEKLEGIKSFALYYIQHLTGILEGNIDPNSASIAAASGTHKIEEK